MIKEQHGIDPLCCFSCVMAKIESASAFENQPTFSFMKQVDLLTKKIVFCCGISSQGKADICVPHQRRYAL